MRMRRWSSTDARLLCIETGESDPPTAIRSLAAALVDEASFSTPPFDPRILASFQGIREIRLTTMRSAARLVPDGDELVIEINGDHSPGKRNFSADHEIVHTLLPTYSREPVEDLVTGTFSSVSEEELLCDIGAASLLIDRRWLRPLAEEYGPSLTTLFALAESFGASLEATARALAELAVWPSAFVCWEEGYRKGEHPRAGQMPIAGLESLALPQPKLRVSRVYATSSFGYFIPPNKSIEWSSLVACCCGIQEPTYGTKLFDFGNVTAQLYCENFHAPYRSGGTLRSRVISLLLPPDSSSRTQLSPIQYSLENF